MALLLDQAAPTARHTIHATDLDRTILAKAREGQFTRADVKNVAPALLERYFTPLTTWRALPPASAAKTADAERIAHTLEPAYQVEEDIRRRIAFRPHNLLADQFEEGYDLICCRNVVIYFTDEAKQTLYRRFHDALKPGGILFVGGTERICNAREMGFEMPIPFFYRRPSDTISHAFAGQCIHNHLQSQSFTRTLLGDSGYVEESFDYGRRALYAGHTAQHSYQRRL